MPDTVWQNVNDTLTPWDKIVLSPTSWQSLTNIGVVWAKIVQPSPNTTYLNLANTLTAWTIDNLLETIWQSVGNILTAWITYISLSDVLWPEVQTIITDWNSEVETETAWSKQKVTMKHGGWGDAWGLFPWGVHGTTGYFTLMRIEEGKRTVWTQQ